MMRRLALMQRSARRARAAPLYIRLIRLTRMLASHIYPPPPRLYTPPLFSLPLARSFSCARAHLLPPSPSLSFGASAGTAAVAARVQFVFRGSTVQSISLSRSSPRHFFFVVSGLPLSFLCECAKKKVAPPVGRMVRR